MTKEIIMPALGMAQESGVLLAWLKQEGELVSEGEPLMEIETDKATVEIEAPGTGILARITAHEGDVIPVGRVIAVLLAGDEVAHGASPTATAGQTRATSASRPAPDGPATGYGANDQRQAPAPATPLAARIAEAHNVDLNLVEAEGRRITKADVFAFVNQRSPAAPECFRRLPASPKARRLASEQEIDLRAVPGSGPEGAVIERDILAFSAAREQESAALAPAAVTRDAGVGERALSRIWQIMAERTTESWTNVPHFYLSREVNATRFIEWRQRAQADAQEKITFTDLLVKVCAMALSRNPAINAVWRDGKVFTVDEIAVSLAMATEEGLVVPVIRYAHRLGLEAIAGQRQALFERAQRKKLRPEDLEGGTFTISNLGMYGVDTFHAILNPPQAAILAVGRIADRIVAKDGQPVVQPMMTLNLACDHRVIDGARGAQFLMTVVALIEEPLTLLS